MKSRLRPARLLRLLAALAAAGLAAAAHAESAAPEASAAAPLTAAQKTALEALDRALARYAALVARDDPASHQAAARAVLEGLRHRRDALAAAFDQSRYDDLRTELNLEYQRLAAWLAPH